MALKLVTYTAPAQRSTSGGVRYRVLRLRVIVLGFEPLIRATVCCSCWRRACCHNSSMAVLEPRTLRVVRAHHWKNKISFTRLGGFRRRARLTPCMLLATTKRRGNVASAPSSGGTTPPLDTGLGTTFPSCYAERLSAQRLNPFVQVAYVRALHTDTAGRVRPDEPLPVHLRYSTESASFSNTTTFCLPGSRFQLNSTKLAFSYWLRHLRVTGAYISKFGRITWICFSGSFANL